MRPIPIFTAVFLAVMAPGHPCSESVEFDPETAVCRLDQIAEALESFTALTGILMEEAGALYPGDIPGGAGPVSIDPALFAGIGNMEWDMQHIGFHNWVRYVRATLEFQRMRIMELELRVAELEGAGRAERDSMAEALSRQAALVEEYTSTGWGD
ncbi:hypothetical protein GX411_08225 [Candidatus Fermentibacteria bacterium]|nr:hypothetical protein [Candidatus Fermentibacteria bacterium]